MMVNLPCLMVSCTNFLRPTCPYTECLLSFQTGSCPTEGTTASYSSCFYFDLTDPPHSTGYGDSVDAPPCFIAVGRCADAVLNILHRDRVPFQNPARFQNYLEPGKVLE